MTQTPENVKDELIRAAAPKMLAALMELKEVLEGRTPIYPASTFHDTIDEAIDAARGQ
tara:strand:- start:210 stop:383 length:174 start_codon:yes stop_codon:yes gene_type:complete